MTQNITLFFRPGRDRGLISRHPDGKIVLPARGERVRDDGPYVAQSLRLTASGRAYIATGLRPGEWSQGQYELGLDYHVHIGPSCPVCAAEEKRRTGAPCSDCGQPVGETWLKARHNRFFVGRCERCGVAHREKVCVAAFDKAWPDVLKKRNGILRETVELSEAPETPGTRISEWELVGVYGGEYTSPDEMGSRIYAYSDWRARFSCGHEAVGAGGAHRNYSYPSSLRWEFVAGDKPSDDRCPECLRLIGERRSREESLEKLRKLQEKLRAYSEEELRETGRKIAVTEGWDRDTSILNFLFGWLPSKSKADV